MKKILAISVLFVAAMAAQAVADTPVYRASFTASGSNPVVTVNPQAGDAIVLFVLSDQHSNSDLNAHTASDDLGGTYWDQYCGSVWKRSSTKYAKMDMLVRGQLAADATPIHISVGTTGHAAAVVAVAVAGLTAVNNYPSSVNGCGSINPGINGVPGTIRQMKNNGYCANCGGVNPITAGTVPVVPKFGQTNPFLATSMTFAVFANEEATQSVLAPSGWTLQSTETTGGRKPVSLSVSTLDSGYSGYLMTWGSSTPTDGNGLTAELQAIQ